MGQFTTLIRRGDKVLIIQHFREELDAAGAPMDERDKRFHRRQRVLHSQCRRGRVCTGVNCPCFPASHLGVAPSTD